MEEDKLLPVSKRWLRRWMEGLSEFIARSRGESPEETAREKEQIMRIFEEKLPELEETAMRYQKRLREVFAL